MKKLVIPQKESEVALSALSNPESLYFGVVISGEKGLISRREFLSGPYLLLCSKSITKGNNWDFVKETDLKDLLKKIVEGGDSVYVFNTPNDLFKWLSE